MRRRRSGRGSWDVSRLRQALAGPNMDTRTWVAMARVDDDDDAIRWDDHLGFVVDVTIQGGPLDQTGPIACRFGNPFVANAGQRSDPPTKGMLVVIMLSEGNPNVACTVIGCLPTPDFAVPTSVNGQTIDEVFAEANHFLVTQHSVQQEVGEKWRTSATSRATLAAPEVRLVSEDAVQPFVRGTDYADALGRFLDALLVVMIAAGTFATAVGAAIPALVVPAQTFNTAISSAFTNALNAYKGARQTYLSSKLNAD